MANLALPALLGLASYMSRNKEQPEQTASNKTDLNPTIGANQDDEDMARGQAMGAATATPAMQADQNQSQAETNRLMNAPATGVPTVMTMKNPSFKQAFSEARLAGDKTFEWNGKTYTTEMAGTKPKALPFDVNSQIEKDKGNMQNTPKKSAPAEKKEEAKVETKETPKGESKKETTKKTYKGLDGKIHTIESKSESEDEDSGFLGKGFRQAMGSKYKKGGAVKAFAKGGRVSASSRADGLAKKGFTKGKIV